MAPTPPSLTHQLGRRDAGPATSSLTGLTAIPFIFIGGLLFVMILTKVSRAAKASNPQTQQYQRGNRLQRQSPRRNQTSGTIHTTWEVTQRGGDPPTMEDMVAMQVAREHELRVLNGADSIAEPVPAYIVGDAGGRELRGEQPPAYVK